MIARRVRLLSSAAAVLVAVACTNSFEIPIDWNALPSCVFQPFDLGTVLE